MMRMGAAVPYTVAVPGHVWTVPVDPLRWLLHLVARSLLPIALARVTKSCLFPSPLWDAIRRAP